MSKESNIISFIKSVLNSPPRNVEGFEYRSSFGGQFIFDLSKRFPMMTTQRVNTYDLVEALTYKQIPLAVSAIKECPFNAPKVDIAKRNFQIQFYVQDDRLFSQVYLEKINSISFSSDIARAALTHRVVSHQTEIKPGLMKMHIGETIIPRTDEERLMKQIKKTPRVWPTLQLTADSERMHMRGEHIQVESYYCI